MDDPQAIRDARPDKSLTESRALSAFDPVGGGLTAYGTQTLNLDIKGEVGKVTVSTS